jgi:hypothetical protein
MSEDVARAHVAPLLLHLYGRCSHEEVLAVVACGVVRVLPVLPSDTVMTQVGLVATHIRMHTHTHPSAWSYVAGILAMAAPLPRQPHLLLNGTCVM